MPAEVRARLFPRHDEEVSIRRATRRLEVVLLIGQAQRPGVVRVQLEMEIAQADDVQPERLHRDQILEHGVERSRQPLPSGEIEMEVVDERLVAGNRLEGVAVREGERGLARLAGVRARVEVHAHLLHGAGRRVVEREILRVARLFLALGHADAEAEPAIGVLPVPRVAQVRVLLAREEEGVRRRKRHERAASRFRGDQSVLRFHARQRRVDEAAEPVLLRAAAGVAPRDARRQIGRQPFQARVVLVRDPFFVRRGCRIHADQVRALVHRELQIAGEDPHRQSGEGDDQARAVRLHAARRRMKRRVGAADLRGRARRAQRAVRDQRIARLASAAASSAAALGLLL